MSEKQYYTTAEAISRLGSVGIAGSTFYRWVREGVIQKELPKGRIRGALYPQEQIEDIISRRRKKHPEEVGETDWIQPGDVPYVLALEYETYGPEVAVDMSISRTWWPKNPYMCRILYKETNRKEIWGVITILPMEENTIFKILRGEMPEIDIKADDILPFELGKTYIGYVATAIIHPQHKNDFGALLHSVLGFWCEQYPSIQLDKLYAMAATDEGLELIKHLFFSPRYDIGDNAFELDLKRRNPSRLIKAFQECIKEREELERV